MINILLRRIVIRRDIKHRIININNDFRFYTDIIDEFLINEFINNKNKKYLTSIRKIIMETEKTKELNEKN